jgi:hypothetical protein
MNWFVLPLIGGGETILRAFCLSACGKSETLYLLFKVQERRFTTPSQDAGRQIYNSFSGCSNHSGLHGEDRIFTHLP